MSKQEAVLFRILCHDEAGAIKLLAGMTEDELDELATAAEDLAELAGEALAGRQGVSKAA